MAPTRGIRNNSKYVEFLWQPFQCSRLWSSITFKWLKIEAYYLRWKCCPWKQLSDNVWHRAVAPRGVAKHQICCVLGLILCIAISRHSMLSTFFLHSFLPPLPYYLSRAVPSPWRWITNLTIAHHESTRTQYHQRTCAVCFHTPI